MPEEEERFEFVQLHSGGSLPGLPGDHAPGSYVIDWQARTITPALSLEAFLSAKLGPAEEQQSQSEQAASETAEQQPAENVTGDTSVPPITLSLG